MDARLREREPLLKGERIEGNGMRIGVTLRKMKKEEGRE